MPKNIKMANKEKLLDLKGKLVVATIFIALFCSFPYTFPRFSPIPELTIIMALELLVLFRVTCKTLC